MNSTNTTTMLYDLLFYNDDDEEYDDWEHDDYSDDKVGVVPKSAYLAIIYFILIFGTIGNACIIALMLAKEFRSVSYSVYLQVLAISDTLLLVNVGIEDILDHQYKRLDDFVTFSSGLCKFWSYIGYVVRLTSPWFVVTMTADRFVAVVFPLKRSTLCSRLSARIISSVFVVAVLCESLFAVILSRTFHDEEGGECFIKAWKSLEKYVIFRTLVPETTLPCLIIFCLNLYIIIVIKRSQRFRAEIAGPSQRQGLEKSSRVDRTTVSLMAVSLMAFVALIPISCLQVVEWHMDNEIYRRESELDLNDTDAIDGLESLYDERDRLGDYWPALNLIFLFNFGHNFYVMLLTGPRFRQKVFSWFQCINCDRRRSQPSSQTTFANRTTDESSTKIEKRF